MDPAVTDANPFPISSQVIIKHRYSGRFLSVKDGQVQLSDDPLAVEAHFSISPSCGHFDHLLINSSKTQCYVELQSSPNFENGSKLTMSEDTSLHNESHWLFRSREKGYFSIHPLSSPHHCVNSEPPYEALQLWSNPTSSHSQWKIESTDTLLISPYIQRESVTHAPLPPQAYSSDSKTLHIRIQTKKNNIKRVVLYYGDPFEQYPQDIPPLEDWPNLQHKEMIKDGEDGVFDYWHCVLTPQFRRCKYMFKISARNQTLWFSENGWSNHVFNSADCFNFPFVHQSDLFRPPSWFPDTIWYQIFPERFGNGDPSLNPEGCLKWGEQQPTRNNFYGGDFQGVIDHIDYLIELGITGLYFTPIFKAVSNHKYDTIDYMELDPQFGTKETFKLMVKKLHENGIKIILDAVFNHSGEFFAPFQDVVKNGENSAYKDWFHIRSFPVTFTPRPNFDCFSFIGSMPKLNTSNPDTAKYLLNAVKYWMTEFDIDGWRLDVANEIDHSFWRKFRKVVKKINPEAVILGEIWNHSMKWLFGDQFDSVMNYPLSNLMIQFINHDINASEYVQQITKLRNWYPENVNLALFNLIGSHDTKRIFSSLNEDIKRLSLIFVLLMTSMGTPCIYYGDEIGMTGGEDPLCRKCMEWDRTKHNSTIFELVKNLIKIRKTHNDIFSKGGYRIVKSHDCGFIAYERYHETGNILVCVNNSSSKSVEVKMNQDLGSVLVLLGSSVELTKESFPILPYGVVLIFSPTKPFVVDIKVQ